MLYVKSDKPRYEQIVKFIVKELQKKAKLVNDDDLKAIEEVWCARGNLVLEDDYNYCHISDILKAWTIDINYDESVLTWHLATDICYYTRSCDGTNEVDHVQISKTLSDYMSYLLLRQQTLVSTVVGVSDKRFVDTCAEAKQLITDKRLDSWSKELSVKSKNLFNKLTCRGSAKYGKSERCVVEVDFMKNICEHMLNDVNVVDVRPTNGEKSKSVLVEACRLAKQLKMLGEETQWEITSKVWLELMCYASVRCSTRGHVAQLNKGGELVTSVSLLMAHLGFSQG
ncbi:hypothetical protein RND81_10G100700 [Saponaria officinalis]|uniref:Uncharacterized protein n=1 Tax=Saponaria officinalis TaxID=3572 RepID=A0AAW1I030_SAPOF